MHSNNDSKILLSYYRGYGSPLQWRSSIHACTSLFLCVTFAQLWWTMTHLIPLLPHVSLDQCFWFLHHWTLQCAFISVIRIEMNLNTIRLYILMDSFYWHSQEEELPLYFYLHITLMQEHHNHQIGNVRPNILCFCKISIDLNADVTSPFLWKHLLME